MRKLSPKDLANIKKQVEENKASLPGKKKEITITEKVSGKREKPQKITKWNHKQGSLVRFLRSGSPTNSTLSYTDYEHGDIGLVIGDKYYKNYRGKENYFFILLNNTVIEVSGGAIREIY
tara:strand:+ start:125 stop:484 length:360 start_codon:yes stop_codon:yes gene_type:complete